MHATGRDTSWHGLWSGSGGPRASRSSAMSADADSGFLSTTEWHVALLRNLERREKRSHFRASIFSLDELDFTNPFFFPLQKISNEGDQRIKKESLLVFHLKLVANASLMMNHWLFKGVFYILCPFLESILIAENFIVKFMSWAVSYTHLTLPTNREV